MSPPPPLRRSMSSPLPALQVQPSTENAPQQKHTSVPMPPSEIESTVRMLFSLSKMNDPEELDRHCVPTSIGFKVDFTANPLIILIDIFKMALFFALFASLVWVVALKGHAKDVWRTDWVGLAFVVVVPPLLSYFPHKFLSMFPVEELMALMGNTIVYWFLLSWRFALYLFPPPPLGLGTITWFLKCFFTSYPLYWVYKIVVVLIRGTVLLIYSSKQLEKTILKATELLKGAAERVSEGSQDETKKEA